MKKVTLLSTLLLAATCMYAQVVKPKMVKAFNWNDAPHLLIRDILKGQEHIANKTTQTKERLIGSDYSYTQFTYFEDDSVRYVYSGTRGSKFDLDAMKYNFPKTPYDYDIALAPVTYYVPSEMEVMCDTAYGQNITSGTYSPSRTTYASYDANNNLVSYYNINVDTTNFKDIHYVNSFNASGNIMANIWFSHSATWDSSRARYFTYDGSGKLTQDSIYTYYSGSPVLTSKYEYTYDAGGKVIGVGHYSWIDTTSSWFHDYQYDLSYYGSGKVQSLLASEDTGTGMFTYVKDSIGYTAGYDYFTSYNEYEFTDTGRTTISTINKHINAAGVPDTVITGELIYFSSSSGFFAQIVNFKDLYYYNSYNDPIASVDYVDWGDGSGYGSNSVEQYFYETYTGVHNVVMPQDVKVYPNPANKDITIQLGKAAIGKNVTINIIDISGRLMKTKTEVWQQTSEHMSIADLARGTYLMYVQGQDGHVWSVQKMIKQ